jgi:hypothetical protein
VPAPSTEVPMRKANFTHECGKYSYSYSNDVLHISSTHDQGDWHDDAPRNPDEAKQSHESPTNCSQTDSNHGRNEHASACVSKRQEMKPIASLIISRCREAARVAALATSRTGLTGTARSSTTILPVATSTRTSRRVPTSRRFSIRRTGFRLVQPRRSCIETTVATLTSGWPSTARRGHEVSDTNQFCTCTYSFLTNIRLCFKALFRLQQKLHS